MSPQHEQSVSMRFFRAIGQDSIAWSLRRLHCPVGRNDLVLEVGSGGNPYCRANVLLDAYEQSRQRHWVPLKTDRPTVLGFVETLPFRDKCFDFVIASHVLEHSSRPDLFLKELQRVSKGGYIEVPHAFFERVNPYRDHRLEIRLEGGALVITKKKTAIVDPELVHLYEMDLKKLFTGRLIGHHPFSFHVRYYWQKQIRFRIENPEVDASWQPLSDNGVRTSAASGIKQTVHTLLLNTFRLLLSQNRRNRAINLIMLLRCPTCGHDDFIDAPASLQCSGCGTLYPVRNGIPVLYPGNREKNEHHQKHY